MRRNSRSKTMSDQNIMDEFALEMNQGVELGDERHYHAESIETPLMLPTGSTKQ
jgi:hypothetical protein